MIYLLFVVTIGHKNDVEKFQKPSNRPTHELEPSRMMNAACICGDG